MQVSSIEYRVSSIEYRVSSIEYRASSIKHRVSSIGTQFRFRKISKKWQYQPTATLWHSIRTTCLRPGSDLLAARMWSVKLVFWHVVTNIRYLAESCFGSPVHHSPVTASCPNSWPKGAQDKSVSTTVRCVYMCIAYYGMCNICIIHTCTYILLLICSLGFG